jgi:hypothetical protein
MLAALYHQHLTLAYIACIAASTMHRRYNELVQLDVLPQTKIPEVSLTSELAGLLDQPYDEATVGLNDLSLLEILDQAGTDETVS